MRGSFIVFEGLDRSGKSSQASILCDSLRSQGRNVLLWKYPARETFLGKTIDGYLKNSVSLPDRSIHLLFSANRWETVDCLLTELNNGTDIVCDRYAYSGIAYSAAKGLDFEWCRSADIGLPQPDLVLYMKVSAEVARMRGGYGEERYEKEEFQRKVGECFMRLSATEGSRWKVVDANRDMKAISAEVAGLVASIPREDLSHAPSKLWMPPTEKPAILVEGGTGSCKKEKSEDGQLSVLSVKSIPFGFLSIGSEGVTNRSFTKINDLAPGETAWIRARAHALRKHGSKLVFIILRQEGESVQAVVSLNTEIAKFAASLTKESVLEVFGRVTVPPEPLRGCTKSDIEIAVERIYCVSKAEAVPLQLEDLSRSQRELEADPEAVRVHIETRLTHRVLDLRTDANQAIFRIQSAVCQLFKEFLLSKGFIEIHTPKLLASSSEGGSSVFELKYFDRCAYLAQSPQFYKQMALMADLPGVFEIGPVFRAEKSLTHRHLTEFTGLDLELPLKEHFNEILDLTDALYNFIFTQLRRQFDSDITTVSAQYPCEPLKWSFPCLRLEFVEAVRLLTEKGPALLNQDILGIENGIETQNTDEEVKRLEKRKNEILISQII